MRGALQCCAESRTARARGRTFGCVWVVEPLLELRVFVWCQLNEYRCSRVEIISQRHLPLAGFGARRRRLGGLARFFLEGVLHTAQNAVKIAQRLVALFEDDAQAIQHMQRAASTALRVFHALCQRPILPLKQVCERTGLSFPAVSRGMQTLLRLGIAREITGHKRRRMFAYDRYLAILNEGTEPL